MNSPKANSLDRSWALLFARLVLGLIFFMAGVYKVFQLGPLEHARKYFLPRVYSRRSYLVQASQ